MKKTNNNLRKELKETILISNKIISFYEQVLELKNREFRKLKVKNRYIKTKLKTLTNLLKLKNLKA